MKVGSYIKFNYGDASLIGKIQTLGSHFQHMSVKAFINGRANYFTVPDNSSISIMPEKYFHQLLEMIE